MDIENEMKFAIIALEIVISKSDDSCVWIWREVLHKFSKGFEGRQI